MKKRISLYLITTLVITGFVLFAFNDLVSQPKQDWSKAKKLYVKHCSKCHRNNADGIKKVYPPLRNADYIKKASTEELLRGMLFGRSGKIVVNGVSYNGVMITEIDKSLTNDDIALMLNYVYKEFNSMSRTVSTKDVEKARKMGKLPPHK